MNERIKELADESARYSAIMALPTGQSGNELFVEKFAELIVAECLSIVNDAERGGSNEVWDNAVKFIRRDIKEHFGVEE